MKQNSSTDEKLSLAIVEALKNKGLTQSEIARQYGVTRQYVSWIKKRYGGRLTPTEQVLAHFPWQVNATQLQGVPYRRLRDHGEFMATGGVGMSHEKLRRLKAFYKRLKDENVVVEFDPNIPPSEGIKHGGFAFRPRTPDDKDLLIRVNEFTNLTPQGEIIWRFPPIEP